MPATTPTFGWPYQTLTDPPDGASLGEDLALAIEATLVAQIAAANAAATAYTNAQLATQTARIDFLYAKPILRARQTATQTLTTATYTAITFTTEAVDLPTSNHDTATNTSRFTAVTAGWYMCSGGVAIASGAGALRATRWTVNGTAIDASSTLIAPVSGNVTVVPARTEFVYLAAGGYVELHAYQDSGGNLSTTVSAETASAMDVFWLRTA